MFGEGGDPLLGVRHLIDESQQLPDYERVDDLPQKERDGLYELQNCAGNAFQLLHDASIASNGHSRMMSISHALENLERFCDELDTLHGLEVVSPEHYNTLMRRATDVIETVKASDADEDEGF